MRKALVTLTLLLLSISAFAQKTIREGMQQIKDKYDISFIYDSEIDIDRQYQGKNLKGKSLRKDLNTLFSGSGIEATVRKNQVILKKKAPRYTYFPDSGVALSEVQLLDSSKIVDCQKALHTYISPRALGIEDIAVTDAAELLKGRAPGVSVASSPAALGTLPTIYIRGVGATIQSKPLYIIDGVRVYSLEGLSADDIESVDAVRDPRVLTIFGPDAADGAIIIKTKRGTKPGVHIAYESQVLIQKPAWAPESITLEEINSKLDPDHSPYSAEQYRCYTMEEGTHTSVSQKHHISAQYGSSGLSIYAGASFLDHDGPMNVNEGYKRETGILAVDWKPFRWLSVSTGGNIARTDLQTDMTYTWSKLIGLLVPEKKESNIIWNGTGYRQATFFNGFSSLECRPLKGLSIIADAGFSNTYEKSVDADWTRWSEGVIMEFRGRENGYTKWHTGVSASYSTTLLGAHNIHAEILYRHRKESYSKLFAHGDNDPIPITGVKWTDARGVLENIFMPDLQNVAENLSGDWRHLDGINPVAWEWEKNHEAISIGYDWKGLYALDGTLMRTSPPDDESIEPYRSWCVSASLDLITAPFIKPYIPVWLKKGVLRVSKGHTYMSCLTQLESSTYFNYPGYEKTLEGKSLKDISSRDYYYIKRGRASRKELGLDVVLSVPGDLSLSATAFENIDYCIIRSSFGTMVFMIPYTITNKGVEFTLGLKEEFDAFRFSVSGNLTLMANEATCEKKVDAIQYKNDLLLKNGYPVGVSQLYEYNPDHYNYYTYKEKQMASYYTLQTDELGFYGGLLPTSCAGVQCMIGWKDLSLSASGHGVNGNTIKASYSNNALWRYYYELYPDGWNNKKMTTAFLLDGSFFRIDQLRLDCKIPVGRLPLNACVYVSLENYFLFTDYPGTDPEMALMSDNSGVEMANYPTSKRILTGIRLAF